MGNHTTTVETGLFAPAKAEQLNTLLRHTFDGLPGNQHRINANGTRVLSRSEAELLVIAVDLHNLGLSPRAIKAVVRHDDAGRIITSKARLLVLEKSGSLSFFDEIDDALLEAMRGQNNPPLLMLDLHYVKQRVQQAIAYTEVRRWNFDPHVGDAPQPGGARDA